ncbi:hypothetical protein CapIbe_021354 [Capra ibex]
MGVLWESGTPLLREGNKSHLPTRERFKIIQFCHHLPLPEGNRKAVCEDSHQELKHPARRAENCLLRRESWRSSGYWGPQTQSGSKCQVIEDFFGCIPSLISVGRRERRLCSPQLGPEGETIRAASSGAWKGRTRGRT